MHGIYPKHVFRQFRVMRNKTRLLIVVTSIVPPGKSVVDIGAGPGYYVRALRDRGYRAIGLEGMEGVHEVSGGLVREVDLVDDCSEFHGAADWGLFCDVGEHVPKKFERTLIDNVSRIPTEGLIVTWAVPGREGRARGSPHVNCRTPEYVAGEFGRRGWRMDWRATKWSRRLCPRARDRLLVLRKG